MGLIEDALARQAAAPAPRRIDYDRMNQVMPRQKAELTRAKNAYRKACEGLANWEQNDSPKVAKARENLAVVIKRHITVWDEIGAWPDNWHTWQIALNDSMPGYQSINLRDL